MSFIIKDLRFFVDQIACYGLQNDFQALFKAAKHFQNKIKCKAYRKDELHFCFMLRMQKSRSRLGAYVGYLNALVTMPGISFSFAKAYLRQNLPRNPALFSPPTLYPIFRD